jgi:hypothetical protein
MQAPLAVKLSIGFLELEKPSQIGLRLSLPGREVLAF